MISMEEENFLRIVYLYYRVVTPALKRFFDGTHPNLSADLNISANKTKILQLYKPLPGQTRVLYKQQIDTLYPLTGTPPVASADIDLTLMVCLLRNLPPVVITPPTGFDKLPPKHDLSDGANIARIKYYKNYLVSHSTSGKIVVSVFNDIWTDLEMAIKGLGNSQDVADANLAKTKLMDSSMTTFLSTQQQLDAKVSRLEDQLTREQCNKTEIITHIKRIEEQTLTTETNTKQLIEESKTNMSSTVQEMQDESNGKLTQINTKIEILEKDQTEFKNLQVVLSKEFERLDKLVNESKTISDDLQSQVELTCSDIQRKISINEERISALEVNLQEVNYSETKKDIGELRIEVKQLQTDRTNVPDWMSSKIQQWKKDEDYFVETTACNHVMRCLLNNKCVSVVGPPGIGKTFLVRHVALKMENIGFNVISVNTPNEIKQNYQLNRKLLFVVDDMCGNFTANTARLDKWKRGIKDITDILNNDSCKLILTCREQVFRDEGFKHSDMEICQACKCNLLDNKLALTYSDKQNIAKMYFSHNYTNDLKRLFKYDFFPLLCKFYFNKSFSIQSILKDPFHCYRKELNNLFLDCKEGKYKFSALLFLTICNNHVEKSYLAGRDKRVNQILEDICYECEINEKLTGKFLMKELDVLTGTYIAYDTEFYHTIHDKLFDFMAYYFGTKNEVTNTEFIGLLIKHSDYNFISERFVIDKPEEQDDTKSEVYHINIQDDSIPLYIERVFSQLTKSADIFEILKSHGDRINKSFHNALSDFINQLPKDTISGLIQNTSSDFVCFMFVMNANEIGSSFYELPWCYTKHYGIILKHDHIQQYIERMFGDMTKSDNVVDYMENCRCCRNEEFRSELHSYLSKLSSITVTDLILNASESFVKNMFVMKVEDIHQSSDSIYERYGIEISTEHIQFFSERFLNVMTCYHYGSEYIRSWRCSKNNDFNLAIQKYMGQLSPKRIRELIENASRSFIQTMFVITVEDISQISFHVYRRYGIEIPGDIIQDYIERMFNDLSRSGIFIKNYLQRNRNRKNTIFQTRLQDYMRQLGEPKIKHFIKIASQDFIDILCVMSINDTGDILYPEYKRYGVIISGDIIQVYIERVFDGLACSGDVDEYLRCNRNITNTIFHTRLLDYMLQLDEQKIQCLIKTASQNFIERLCVMSIDDIKDDWVFGYERYGVIIPEDSLWLYIARWLDKTITLDDTEKYVERNRNRKTKLFTTSLCTFMKQLKEDVIEKLIQTGSADFLHKWFVTEGDIDNSIKGYEQCGIILKDENLQKYNERILTLMNSLWYYKYKVPRSVMTYINKLQILRITELLNEAGLNFFHNMIAVDFVKDLRLEKIYSESQSVDYAIHNNFQMNEELHVIRCPESLINQYMDRMISDWRKGAIYHVISNNNLKNQSFVDNFVCHLNSLDQFKLLELLQTKDYIYNEQKALTLCCTFGEVNLAKWCLENHFHGNPKTKRNQLCALLLLVVFNGRLEENVLHDELSEVNDVILAFNEMHDIRECTTFSDVKEQLDVSLKEIMVKKEGAYYVECARVFDFLVFYFAWNHNMSQILVDYADEILLYNKFLVEPPISKQHDFIFHISDEQLQTCTERVFKWLSKSEENIRYVLTNVERRNDIIVKSVTAHIIKLNAKEINIIFENACIDFLNKMCIIVSKDTKDPIVEESELYFVIPDYSILSYIKRIFYLVAKSDCVAACLQDNRNAKNDIFRAKLSSYMTEFNRDDIQTLINQASSDFINRMFITSRVEINDESCWEYERYGIFVHEDYLQMYIKSVFNDMTKSVYVPVNRNSENQAFRDNLNLYINSLSEDILASLIQTASSKFISRLYLSKEENITEIRSRELECSMVLVPMKYCEMFRQKLKGKFKRTKFCSEFTLTEFKIEKDSFRLNLTTFEKRDSDDVLIRMMRKNEKNIGNLQEHLEKYINPLFTCKTIEYCIRSTKGLERIYIQRMIGDWIEGHIYDVFCNINLGNLSFKSDFLNYLQTIDDPMQTKLANTNDNSTFDSPLAVCCFMGISQLAEWCIDQNININSLNIYREHLLYIAYTQNGFDIVLKLLNHKNRAYIDTDVILNILNKACKSGRSEIVVQLLKEKVDINCNDSMDYKTPLFTACKYGFEKIVSILLECKADEIDLNKGLSDWYIHDTPLYIACKRGHAKIVFLLLNHKADEVDVNKRSTDSETPLHAACEGGYKDIVSLLLAQEPNGINIQRLDGATPLFVSCLKGHGDVVSTLLTQKGIKKDECTLAGMSPLYVASLLRHSNIVEKLLNRNANADICVKIKYTVGKIFQRFVTIPDMDMDTHSEQLFIIKCKKKISKLIIDNASVHVKSYIHASEEDWVVQLIFGSSPLHIGSFMGHTKIVTLLVDRTSSIDCFTENGSTPLFLACELGHKDIVRVLLDNKANPTLERKDGKSPLSIARENGHLEIAEIISQTVKDNLYHSESIPE